MRQSCIALWAYAAFAILSHGEKLAAEDSMCSLSGRCHKNKQALLQFGKTVSTGQTNRLVQTNGLGQTNGLAHTDGVQHTNELVHTNGLLHTNGLENANGTVNSIGLVHTNGHLHTNRLEQTHYRVHTEGCQRSKQSPVNANFAALSEEGYASVAALCCHEDMRVYITRVAAAEGFRVCNDGGLSGILWWYDCSTDQNNYAKLLQSVKDASTDACPWVGAPDNCPTMPSECYLDKPELLPDCTTTAAATTPTATAAPTTTAATPATTAEPVAPAAATTSSTAAPATTAASTTHCCRLKTSFLSTKVAKLSPAASVVTAFDCEKYPGAIQVIKNSKQGGYDVKQLDVATGIYNVLYQIPFSRTTPDFDSLNAVAVNPVDGIAYGLLHFGDKKNSYLVRFDEVAMEFVAKVKKFSPAGTFSLKGTYYYEVAGLFSIANAAQLTGFPDQNGNVAQLQDADSITGKFQKFNVLDLAAYVGDLEGGEREDDYIFSLDDVGKLLVVKDTGAGSTYWIMDTTASAETKGFGAGWSFKQSVYFSANEGTGVYQIPVTSMNVNEGLVMIKKVGASEATSSNDGMNCMELDSPFPPPEEGCGEGFEEVPPQADGTCPANAFRA